MTVHESADVSPDAEIGEGTHVWGLAQLREGSSIGRDCVIGRAAYIGVGVRLGNRVKVQNLAQVYEPAVLADGVFVGPGVILTNDQHPRAVTPEGRVKTAVDWDPVGVVVAEGASIGARAVCVAPLSIGRWAMVGAGATVVDDVPDFALVVGAPARRIGWVGRSGVRLVRRTDGVWECPVTKERYVEAAGQLAEEDRD